MMPRNLEMAVRLKLQLATLDSPLKLPPGKWASRSSKERIPPNDTTDLFDCFRDMLRTGQSPTAGQMNEAQKRRNAV